MMIHDDLPPPVRMVGADRGAQERKAPCNSSVAAVMGRSAGFSEAEIMALACDIEAFADARVRQMLADKKLAQQTRDLTEGERRVGACFNPSGLTEVDSTKFHIAGMIDVMLAIAADRNHPGARAAAIAATNLEEACMWQVKALTARN